MGRSLVGVGVGREDVLSCCSEEKREVVRMSVEMLALCTC